MRGGSGAGATTPHPAPLLASEERGLNQFPLPAARGEGRGEGPPNAVAAASLRIVLIFALLLVSISLRANQLSVDTRTLRMNDLATITVSLEGDFAKVEAVSPPVENLAIVGEPWVSTEFAWINGQVSRRKVFRFRVRPIAPGRGRAGPMPIATDDGAKQVLPAVDLEIIPDRAFGSNDAESVLGELTASNRDPVFVISEVGDTTAFAGEPVRITWYLYNGVDVQQWQIVNVPPLQDFWTEEVPVRNEPPERVIVGSRELQRIPIRRVVVYPLRTGALRIGGMTIEAQVMRRFRTGFWARFEGELVETSFTSAPITIIANPIPQGPPVDAVGDLTMVCDPPQQRNAGPVVVGVTLKGEGNLRGVAAPRFTERVAGDVLIEGGEVATSREEGSVAMARRWRYLIFPAREGLLYVPPLALRTFVPATAERKELRCEAATLEALAAAAPAPETPATRTARSRARLLPWGFVALLVVLLFAVSVPRVRHELALRREARGLVDGRSPAEIRAAVEARVGTALLSEQSDRGDAWRSLRSLLDAAERERDIAVDAEDEIVRRVRELLRIVR